MTDKLEMTVKFQVKPAQALALQAMFEHWNYLSAVGSSRCISFFVDGCGDFHPKAEIEFSKSIPGLTDEMRQKAAVGKAEIGGSTDGNLIFDYDPLAWMLRDD